MSRRLRGQFYGTAAYRRMRRVVLVRDLHQCQACGDTGREKPLHVHHLRARGLGYDSRDPRDYVTLCARCNSVAGQTSMTPAQIGELVGAYERPRNPLVEPIRKPPRVW